MPIGSMSKGLYPMYRSGGTGSASSGLPPGFPTTAAARIVPGQLFLDDFWSVSVGTSSASAWTLTQVGSGAGTAGLQSSTNSGTVLTAGVFGLATGTTANDLILAELSQRTAAVNSLLNVSATTENGAFNLMLRASFGATRTLCKHGFGFIDSTVANGTDWITDPDTVLGAGSTASIIVHRHASAAYGAGGMATNAGDVSARFYDNSGTDQRVVLVTAAALTAAPYKFEFVRAKNSNTITCYVDGAVAGTFSTSNSAFSTRPSFGVITEPNAVRIAALDAYLMETGATMPAR